MFVALLAGIASASDDCAIELVVLGAGQDAGAPQIGNNDDPGWSDPAFRLTATSLALVDRRSGSRYLFEATPHITEQMQRLDALSPPESPGLGIDGVFLTHAHIGHYAGLMFFGLAAAGAHRIPVHVMPRFADYLRGNGPWSQLVALGNISITELAEREPHALPGGIAVTPYPVPHRDEYSETVGLVVTTPGLRFLFLPDIDSWKEWEAGQGLALEAMLETVDLAFLDATFFDDDELPGRDMSEIPHPRVTGTMDRLQGLPDALRSRVHFIHYNHTNPIRFPDSPESRRVVDRGFGIARSGQRLCLAPRP